MNILKEVLKHEVFPALGCTEPIAVAYAAGMAAQQIQSDIETIRITVDPRIFTAKDVRRPADLCTNKNERTIA